MLPWAVNTAQYSSLLRLHQALSLELCQGVIALLLLVKPFWGALQSQQQSSTYSDLVTVIQEQE